MNQNITGTYYNGVNHDLRIYQNPNNFAVNRKKQYFLKSKETAPDYIIPQQKPLSAKTTLLPSSSMKGEVFLPHTLNATIDSLPDYSKYDRIIVSSIYASTIMQMSQTSCIDPNYLDRLYSPVPLYSEDPQNKLTRVSKVGCVGFQKVCNPYHPQYYLSELNYGRMPSKTSMKLCIEMYQLGYFVCDDNTRSLLRHLDYLITNML